MEKKRKKSDQMKGEGERFWKKAKVKVKQSIAEN